MNRCGIQKSAVFVAGAPVLERLFRGGGPCGARRWQQQHVAPGNTYVMVGDTVTCAAAG